MITQQYSCAKCLTDVDDEVRAIKSSALEIDYIDAEEDEEEA